jgi:3-dehydroquinate dehydratase-1
MVRTVKFGNLEIGGEKKIFLCSVIESTVSRTIAAAQEAVRNGADGIEFRIDAMPDLPKIGAAIQKLRKLDCPALVVCRPGHVDGYFSGTEEERTDLLLDVVDKYRPDMIDIEYTTSDNLLKKVVYGTRSKNVPLMICYENFGTTPPRHSLNEILTHEQTLGADVAKVAVKANTFEDAGVALMIAEDAKSLLKIPYVAIAMGEHGSSTRALSLVAGASMTYCAVKKGKEGAPGQLPVRETKKLYELLKLKTS